jgi:hypothetical protein
MHCTQQAGLTPLPWAGGSQGTRFAEVPGVGHCSLVATERAISSSSETKTPTLVSAQNSTFIINFLKMGRIMPELGGELHLGKIRLL